MLNLPDKTLLSRLDVETLKLIESKIEVLLFKQPIGEPFHPVYRKDKKAFNKLITGEVRLRRAIKKYFKDLSERLNQLVYIGLIMAADKKRPNYFNTAGWEDEDQALAMIILPELEGFYENGANSAHVTINIGVDSSDAPAQKFLRDYSLKLAKDINSTTQDNIQQQIQTSIKLGETRQQLESRLTDVIDNSYRSQMIAQTESIRAFTQGRLAVGQQMGVQMKRWQTYGAVDDLCVGAQNQGAIPIDQEFDNGTDGPPAHPNCRCAIKLVMGNTDGNTDNSDDQGQ